MESEKAILQLHALLDEAISMLLGTFSSSDPAMSPRAPSRSGAGQTPAAIRPAQCNFVQIASSSRHPTTRASGRPSSSRRWLVRQPDTPGHCDGVADGLGLHA